MNLPQPKRDELIAKVSASGLRPEAKERILALLSKEEITAEEALELNDIVQGDIMQDMEEAGLGDAFSSFIARNDASLVAQAEKEAGEIRAFIEEQTGVLDAAEADLLEAERALKIEETRKNLGAS